MRKLVTVSLLAGVIFGVAACTQLPSPSRIAHFNASTWASPLLVKHPLVGKIFSASTGQELTSAELIQALVDAPTVLIGEKHDNPDHHRIEAWLLHQLVDENTAVVFEMLDDRHVAALDADQNTSLQDLSLDQLKDHLAWKDKGWEWQDYGSLFEQVIAEGGSVIAGNIDRARMMKIYKSGASALQGEERFASLDSIDQKQRDEMLEEVFEAHCEKMSRDHLGPMVTIQLAKDASMASALRNASGKRKILLAGGVHQLKAMGVPSHGRLGEPIALTVQLLEVEEGVIAWNDSDITSVEDADYVWFTPKFTGRDYCDDIK